MRAVLPLLFAATACGSAVVPPPPDPVVRPAPRPGQDVLRLDGQPDGTFHLVNVSTRDQRVLPALDGSLEGVRVPWVTLEYRDDAGNPVVPPPRLGCGNINALQEANWVTLAPGESLQVPGG